MGRRMRAGALWLCFAVFTWFRFPHLFTHPDLYGEEAVYFLAARSEPWWRSLFAVRFGYLSLAANVIGEIATAVPLPHAPMLVRALAVMLGPGAVVAVIIAIGASFVRSVAAIAIVVTTPLMVAEWATAIHLQFWLVVALLLCLVVEFDTPWRSWSGRVLAVVTVLSAGPAAALFPFFGWRAWRDRERVTASIATILVVGGVLQLVLGAERGSAWSADRFLAALLQQDVFEGLFGVAAAPIGVWLRSNASTWAVTLAVVVALGLVIAGSILIVPPRFRVAVVAAVTLGSLATWFALEPDSMFEFFLGERYAVVGTVPILILILLGAELDGWGRVSAVVVVFMAPVGAGLALGRAYDAGVAARPDYWRESLERDDGEVQANGICRYLLDGSAAPKVTTEVTLVDGGFRVDVGDFAPLAIDPANRVYLSSSVGNFNESWVDGEWIDFGGFTFGGPEYPCYTGPKDRPSSELEVTSSAVIIPEAAVDRSLETGRAEVLGILIGPTYEEAVMRQQLVAVPFAKLPSR